MEALTRSFFPRNEHLNVDNGLEDTIPEEIDVGLLFMRFYRLKARITGEMWRHVCLAVPSYIETLMIECERQSYFPKDWKARNDPNSYRGISLLPVLGKVLERMSGPQIWNISAVTKTVEGTKVLPCQRIMLLGCLRVCRTVSTYALQVLLGVPPLDLEVIRRGGMICRLCRIWRISRYHRLGGT